jgi:asparagine synthetase B (glutamine-hydrolysing)
MLLLYIGRHAPTWNEPHLALQRLTAGKWQVYFQCDDLFGSLRHGPEGCALLAEDILFQAAETGEFTGALASASVDPIAGRAVIEKKSIGGRPLYYYADPSTFVCTTHVKNFKKLGIALAVNEAVLPEYFVYRLVMPPHTLYQNIRQLIPGQKAVVDFQGDEIRVRTLHRFLPDRDSSEESQAISEASAAFYDSIKALSAARDAVAVFLSGGLDSSTIYRIAHATLGISKSCSTGYPFEDVELNTEKAYALSAARALGSEHTYLDTTAEEYQSAFIQSIWAAEEPLHHVQSPMMYLLCEKGLHQEENIILSGFGAGTFFGLHYHYEAAARLGWKHRFLKQPIRNILRLVGAGSLVPEMVTAGITGRTSLRADMKDAAYFLWGVGVYGDPQWVRNTFGCGSHDIVQGRLETINAYADMHLYDQISIVDYLGDACLTQYIWGKIAESHGKKMYYPFTSEKFIKSAFSMSWNYKMKYPKHAVKEIARHSGVPEFIITRPKSGFGIQNQGWISDDGPLGPLIDLTAELDNGLKIHAIDCRDAGSRMIRWNILNFVLWKAMMIDNLSPGELTKRLEANKRQPAAMSR